MKNDEPLLKSSEREKNKLIKKQLIISKEIFGDEFSTDPPSQESDKTASQIAFPSSLELKDETDLKQITKEDFNQFLWTKWNNLLFLSRTLWWGHSLWIQWMYEWILK